MRADRTLVSLGTLALLLFGAGSAKASYPAGVWVKVQQVELEPDATAPTKVKIHGAAMLYDKSTGTSYSGYTDPAFGVLYYECKGDKQTCVDEWTDVQKNIAEPNDVCVGLGDQALPTGTLHPPASKPTTPDTYPIAMGVLEGFTPCQVINQFLFGQPDSGTGGSAGSTGSGGTAGSTGSGGSATGGSSSGGASSGGASSGGASSGGSSSGGASSGGTSSGGDKDAEDDGGCSLSTGTAGGSFALLALGALGLAAGLRRRRS